MSKHYNDMNGPGETWIDLMSKDPITKRHSKKGGASGVTITSNTPRTKTRYVSRVMNGDQQQDQVEILRSQVVGLSQEKQELMKKVQSEKVQRELLEKEMESIKSNKSTHFNGDDQSTTTNLQVCGLRQALDEVTQERNTLRDLLSQERNESEKDIKLKHKDIEIQGLKAQLKQLRQELNTLSQLEHQSSYSQSNYDVIENLKEQLVEKDEKLSKSEREREALRDRLVTVEAQRQLSMEQYQEEVETSVMAVTTQLEELLELNQQLQKELTTLQAEKEGLVKSLDKENKTRENEKVYYHQQLTNHEEKVTQLNSELKQVKEELNAKTETSQKELELKKQLEHVKKENEKQLLESESVQLELTHQQTLLKQEKQSLLHKIESIQAQFTKTKSENKRLEGELDSLRADLTKCQRDKGTCEAQVVTMKTELSSSHEQCSQLKKELNEVRDVAQAHSRQQVEALNQQLVQKSQQLQRVEEDKRQLLSKVKKLESKTQEMMASYETSSTKLSKDLNSLTTDYNKTQSQLKQIQSTNIFLQEKTQTLQEEVDGWKKQVESHKSQLNQMNNLVELKNAKIKELEKTIGNLNEELDEVNSQREHSKGQTLLSQIQSLQESIAMLQEERETLDSKLKVEMERNKASSQSEKELREENAKLQELLNSSLSLNDKLQSSMELNSSSNVKDSSLGLSPSRATPPPAQFSSSPVAEVAHLKQELVEARQTCLRLEKKQAEDQTEMAKVKGSLEALVKIQDHLSMENKSLEQTFSNLEEEKEIYKREVKKLSSELGSCRENLEKVNVMVSKFMEDLQDQLSELVKQVDPPSGVHALLTECQQSMKSGQAQENLEIARRLVESLSLFVLENSHQLLEVQSENKALSERINNDDSERQEEIVQLQEKISGICEEMKDMRKEVELKENELEEKERQLATLHVKLNENDSSRTMSEECLKKDLEIQYQAKLAVLRGNLMDREDEVGTLQSTLMELKTQLNETEVILSSVREELSEAKEELQIKRELVTRHEESLKNEREFLENETETLANAVVLLKSETTGLKQESQRAQVANQKEENQLRAVDERLVKLRGEIEMLRAKKSVFDNYLQAQETSQEGVELQEKEEILQENAQLVLENEDLKQELLTLSEGTQRLQEQVDVLIVRLQDVEEERNEDREMEKRELEERHQKQLEEEVQHMKMELQTAQDEFQHYYNMLEGKIEEERLQLRSVERERDTLTREISLMKEQLVSMEKKQKQEMAMLQERLSERDSVFADMQSSLEHAMANREALEVRLNESCPGDSTHRKIDKLKVKLKQQVKQSNHLRMKLGYALSELRLYKQLKKELDNQVAHLQLALTQTQQQYEQCLDKLNEADKLESHSRSSSFKS